MVDYPRAIAQLLIDVSIRALVLAGLAAIVLRFWPARNANFKHRAWTAVLWGMLLLPVLEQMTPAISLLPSSLAWHARRNEPAAAPAIVQIDRPSVPADEPANEQPIDENLAADSDFGAQPAGESLGPNDTDRGAASDRQADSVPAQSAAGVSTTAKSTLGWPGVALALYLGGVAVLLARLMIGYWGAQRMAQRATEIPRPLGCRVRVAASNAVRVPVTLGTLRPVILLPADWHHWSAALLASVVTHEQAHVDRRDHLVLLASELNRCLYWFHPVAWFLRRRLSALAEQCCDDTVIAALRNRGDYAQHLLEIAERLSVAPYRVAPVGISMARTSQVESRIVAILDEHRPLAGRIGRRGALALLAIVGPIVLLAAGLRAADPPPQPQQAAVAQEKVAPTAAPEGAPTAETKAAPTAQSETPAEAAAEKPAVKGQPLSGRVVLAADGSPAAGAELQLLLTKPDRFRLAARRLKADEQGAFSFEDVPAGSHWLVAVQDGLASRGKRSMATFVNVAADHPPEPMLLELSPAPSIAVHVTSKADGAPVAGAQVWLIDNQWDEQTDALGGAVLRGLTPEVWRVKVQAEGFAAQTVPLKLEGDQRAELNFALEPGGKIHGTVKDHDGKPLADQLMGVRYKEDPYPLENTHTDAQGYYHFDFLPLSDQLQLDAGGEPYIHARRDVAVPAGGDRDVEVNLVLERRPVGGSIQGLVSDVEGKPIAGAALTNRGNSSNDVHETFANAAGRFTMDDLFTSGKGTVVVFRAKGFAPQAVSVDPGPADGPTEIAVKLEPGHRIRGRVLDAAGQPIAGVRIQYGRGGIFQADSVGGSSTTDAQGRFEFDSLPADCPFEFQLKGFSPLEQQTLALDGEQEVTVTLQSQGLVRGRVVNAASGAPIARFRVRITHSRDREPDDPKGGLNGSRVQIGEQFEAADGQFVLDDLMVGLPLDVTVEAENYGVTTLWRVLPRPAADTAVVEFKLGPSDPAKLATVSGTFVDEAGRPKAGVQLRLIAAERQPALGRFRFQWPKVRSGQVARQDGVVQFLSATTDRQGAFHFDRVRIDQEVELWCWGEGVSDDRIGHLEELTDGQRKQLRIENPAPGAIEGKINREKFPAVNNVTAVHQGVAGIYVVNFRNQPDKADFQLRNLPPGKYRISVNDETRLAKMRQGGNPFEDTITVVVEAGKTTTLDLGFDNPPAKDAEKKDAEKKPEKKQLAPEKPAATTSTDLPPQPQQTAAETVSATESEPAKTGAAPAAVTAAETETKEATAATEAAATAGWLLRGRVIRESDGAAAAGAEVRLMTSKLDRTGFTTRTTKTDDEGNFSFENVPGGSHRVLAILDDLVSRRERYQAMKIEIDANHPPAEPIVLKLSPAPSIRVHVASQAGGAPVADARVRLFWSDTERDHATDAAGNVLLRGLTPEIWTVEVQAAGFAEQTIPIKLTDDQRAELDFALLPGGVLRGVVRNDSGQALADVGISIRAANQSEQLEYVKSDAEGRYRFDFLPLDQQLEMSITAPQYANARQKTIVPSEGSRDVELDLVLERRPDGGSVTGIVVDGAGKPIAGAKLTNQGNSGNRKHETTTDAAGRFTIDNLYASTFGYQVVVRADGYAPRAITVEPGPADAPAKALVKLAPGHRIRGQVVDGAGKPIAGVRVSFAHGDEFRSANIGGGATTDSMGRFAFDSLPAECPFAFRATGYSPINDKMLSLDGADEVTVTLQSQGVVRGRVVDAQTGKPITAFTVRITFSPDHEPNDPRSGLSGPAALNGERFDATNGEFSLGDLMVGLPVQVTVEADHFGRATRRRIVARPEPEAEIVRFELAPVDPATLATLKGTITNEEGKPIAGAELRLIVSNEPPVRRDQFPFNWQMIQNGQVGQVDGVVQFLSTTSNQQGDFHFDQVRSDKDIELAYWGDGVSEGRLEHVEKLPAAERDPLRVVVVTPGGLQGKISRDVLPHVGGISASRRDGRDFTEFFDEQSGKSYHLRNLPPGAYDLVVYGERVRTSIGAESYTFKILQRQTVHVESGKTTTVDIGFDTPPDKGAEKKDEKQSVIEKPAATTSSIASPAADDHKAPPPDHLTGRVVDDAGVPIGEALVSLRLGEGPAAEGELYATSARTDAAGHFVLKFPPDWPMPGAQTSVWAYAPGHCLGVTSASMQQAPRERGEIEIVLGPATDTAFRVVDPQEKPVAGASVEPWWVMSPQIAYNHPPEDICRAVAGVTDAEGIVRLPGANRKALKGVQVAARGFGEQRTRVESTAPAPLRTIHLRPVGRLELKVTGGTPEQVAGLRVTASTKISNGIQSLQPDETQKTEGEAAGVTDGQGVWVVPELAEGEVRFAVYVDRAVVLRARLPEKLPFRAGQTNRVEIPLQPGVRVRGQVRGKADAKPIAGAVVGIYYGDGNARQSELLQSGADGSFETYVLPGPLWQRVVRPPATFMQSGDSNRQQTIPATQEVFELPPIELIETIEIAGRVIDQFENPVVEVRVNGVSANGIHGTGLTDADGRFTMRVPPDLALYYQVRVEDQGHVDADIVRQDPLVLRIRVVK